MILMGRLFNSVQWIVKNLWLIKEGKMYCISWNLQVGIAVVYNKVNLYKERSLVLQFFSA